MDDSVHVTTTHRHGPFPAVVAMEMKSRWLLTCLIAWVLLTCNVLRAADDNEYTDEDQPLVRVMNEAGAPLHVYWIDPENGDEVLLSSKAIAAGQSMTLNSFNTHRFVVRYEDTHPSTLAARFTKSASHEVAVVTATAHHMLVELTPLDTPDELAAWRLPSGGSSGSGRSRQTTSAVNEVVAEVGEDAEVEEYEYEYVRPRHVAALAPLQRVKHAVGVCEHTKGDRINFSRCMMAAAKDDLEVLVRKKDSTIKSRDRMASRLRNYTCEDDALQTTPPLYSQRFHVIDRDHDVHMLLDEPRAKIWTVNDFISADECDVLKRVGGPHLRRATVADEGGAAVVSENRKAQQARYRGADNEVFTADDPLFPLYQRIFNLTNEVASYRLHTDGQEGFMLIQYNKEDQYTPHCDGDCDDNQFVQGGRVATCVLYCEAPTRGGATTFTKADVFVKPARGMATFFSYKGPDGMMDPGHTEHSGCPVLEGEKWIATVWMREGVSLDRPQSMFDPSGGLLMDEVVDSSE